MFCQKMASRLTVVNGEGLSIGSCRRQLSEILKIHCPLEHLFPLTTGVVQSASCAYVLTFQTKESLSQSYLIFFSVVHCSTVVLQFLQCCSTLTQGTCQLQLILWQNKNLHNLIVQSKNLCQNIWIAFILTCKVKHINIIPYYLSIYLLT